MMTTIDRRQPSGLNAPIHRHSGTMVPSRSPCSDGHAGGEIPVDQYRAPVPPSQGGQGK
jgi:hypothetical protein